MIKVELTDREVALIVRTLRFHGDHFVTRARLIAEIDAGGAADGVCDLISEIGTLADRLNALKIAGGGAAS